MLLDNHGHFGDDPCHILANIEPESEIIKNLVLFQSPFLGFLAFFEPI